jgi:hypothetical protein
VMGKETRNYFHLKGLLWRRYLLGKDKFQLVFFFVVLRLRTYTLSSGPTPWAIPPAHFCDDFFLDRILQTICPG